VLYLRDLGIMPHSVQTQTLTAQRVWEQNWAAMQRDEAAAQRITQAIKGLRGEVRVLLVRLQ